MKVTVEVPVRLAIRRPRDDLNARKELTGALEKCVQGQRILHHRAKHATETLTEASRLGNLNDLYAGAPSFSFSTTTASAWTTAATRIAARVFSSLAPFSRSTFSCESTH